MSAAGINCAFNPAPLVAKWRFDWLIRPAESPGVSGVFFDWIVAGSTLRHTTLSRLSAPISSALKPNSARTSSVCSPNSGGRAAILLGVRDKVTG